MDRRRFLAGVAALSATTLAGCSSLTPPTDSQPAEPATSQYTYFLTLSNYTETTQTVAVHVENADGDVLHDTTYRVAGRSAREHVPVDGQPATATVRVTGHDPESLTWPSTATCREQNTAGYPGLEVSVRDPADGRTRADYTFSCQSVTADSAASDLNG